MSGISHRNKIIFIILFVFFVINSCLSFAQPPGQVNVITDSGYEIAYPKFDSFVYGNDINLHFHVFDENGTAKNNITSYCLFHLYDNNGNHIIESYDMTFDSNGIDWEQNISKNLLPVGRYSFVFQCNDTTGLLKGGFVSQPFIVTKKADLHQKDTFAGLIIFIFYMVITFFFIILPFVVKIDKDKFFHTIYSRLFWFLGILFFWQTSLVVIDLGLYANLDFSSKIFNLISFILIKSSYFWILFVLLLFGYQVLDSWKKKIDGDYDDD